MDKITLEKAKEELNNRKSEAETLLKDKDKLEKFLNELEEKLKKVPKVGEHLSYVPVLISLVRSYINKEYTDISVPAIVLTVSALIYVLSPIDIIPDGVPLLGFIDDGLIVMACLTYIEVEVKDYIAWREKNKK